MLTFEDRERAFEAKYAHDEHFRFRVLARRDKLFSKWAAKLAGLDEAAETDMQHALLALTGPHGHDLRVVGLVDQILRAHGHRLSRDELTAALHDAAAQAHAELVASAAADEHRG